MPTEKPSEHQIDPGDPAQGKIRSKFVARLRPRKTDEAERKKQLQDYLTWVNNYLRRRPGVRPISDLRTGLQDGIALVNLVEIAANAEIPFVERSPTSQKAKIANLQKAISFLTSDGVRLQGDPVKDITDGSVKGVLRVILAIAEKYNPRSVRRINTGPQPSSPRERTSSGPIRDGSPDRPVVHDLPSSFPQTQYPLATSSLAPPNLPTAGVSLSQGVFGMSSFSQGTGYAHNMSLSQGAGLSLSQPVVDSIYSTPVDSLPENVVQRISSQMPPHRVIGQRIIKANARPRAPSPSPKPPLTPVREGEDEVIQPGDAHRDIATILKQMAAFKSDLLGLHGLLLENNVGEMEGGGDQLPLEVANADMLAKEKEIAELQDSVVLLREQLEKWESECETLQNMVRERNQFITSMKSEIYRKEYRNDTERVDMRTQMIQKEKKIAALETELAQLKEEMEEKEKERVQLTEAASQQQVVEAELRQEMDCVQAELTRAAAAEESLHVKLSTRDKKIAHLEERLAEGESRGRRLNPAAFSEEMDTIREELGVLRGSLSATDPQQEILDGLEKSISELMAKIGERARSSSPGKRARRHHEQRERRKAKERERKGSLCKEEAVSQAVATPTEGTKVFYYLDRSETPYVTTVPRKMSEVRLRDFRAVFDRQGAYRFYFKTEDPDCGVVREEITDNDQLLPCWNGKIIVWVSEKTHHHHHR